MYPEAGVFLLITSLCSMLIGVAIGFSVQRYKRPGASPHVVNLELDSNDTERLLNDISKLINEGDHVLIQPSPPPSAKEQLLELLNDPEVVDALFEAIKHQISWKDRILIESTTRQALELRSSAL